MYWQNHHFLMLGSIGQLIFWKIFSRSILEQLHRSVTIQFLIFLASWFRIHHFLFNCISQICDVNPSEHIIMVSFDKTMIKAFLNLIDWYFPQIDWYFPHIDWYFPQIDWYFTQVDWYFTQIDLQQDNYCSIYCQVYMYVNVVMLMMFCPGERPCVLTTSPCIPKVHHCLYCKPLN